VLLDIGITFTNFLKEILVDMFLFFLPIWFSETEFSVYFVQLFLVSLFMEVFFFFFLLCCCLLSFVSTVTYLLID